MADKMPIRWAQSGECVRVYVAERARGKRESRNRDRTSEDEVKGVMHFCVWQGANREQAEVTKAGDRRGMCDV